MSRPQQNDFPFSKDRNWFRWVLSLKEIEHEDDNVWHDPDLVLGGIMLARRAANVLYHPFIGRFLGRGFWSHRC